MPKGKRYAKRTRRRPAWVGVLALLVVAAAGILRYLGVDWNTLLPAGAGAPAASQTAPEGTLQVYYFDVGQADSELICLPTGEHILIDAGTSSTQEELVRQLRSLGAETLDLVVATHPHADHIGGMAAVLEALTVEQIVMPVTSDSSTPTTQTYEALLDAIGEEGLTVTPAQAGEEIWNGGGASLQVLAPNAQSYGDLNDYSVVLRLAYGADSFLFTGDAEETSEEEMLSRGWTLNATVLKCGHHGSETSTSQPFLDTVRPQYAVISCGVDNDYGHPDQVTLDRLEAAGAEVFRTDLQGTIVASTEGSGVTMTALGKGVEAG